ncbi:MAG: TonB-dependent receptor [Kofleriaceae bacterium]|nr:TonB-dependent receptor [Kofleriaceae bacterium]
MLATRVAAADELTTAPDETIVVNGVRPARPLADVPATVRVVGRAEIEHSPARFVDDLLRTLPSVGTFRRSSSAIADPTSQGLSLRGIGPSAVSRALVLRDGVPANDPFGGWMYWRSISALDLDRIEIAPSGASAMFGDFALGGVLDLVSRPITDRSAEVLVAGGTQRTARAAARVTDLIGAFGVVLDGDVFRSDGYAPVAPSQRGAVDGSAGSLHGTAGLRVRHRRGDSTTHLTSRWFRESLDAGTLLTTADVETFTLGAGYRLERTVGMVALELFGGAQELRQQRARVTTDRATATLASKQHTSARNVGGLATWTQTIAGRHALVLGVDGRYVRGTATDVLSPPMIGGDTVVERSAGGEQRFAALFAQDTWHASNAIDVSATLRIDGWQNRAGTLALTRGDGQRTSAALDGTDALQIDPRVGVRARLSDVVSVRGSAYRAFRAPTLNELYRPFQVGTVLTEANAALRPEILWGAELGPQFVVEQIDVRATAFYNLMTDAIGNVTLAEPLANGATRMRQNFGTARIAGLELELSWRASPSWLVAIANTYAHSTVVEAPAAPMLVGKRLAHDPRYRATGSVTYTGALDVSTQVRYLGRQFEDDVNTLSMGAVVLVDARIARSVGHGITVFTSGENLFDRRYVVGRAGVDTLGSPRTFEVGAMFATH